MILFYHLTFRCPTICTRSKSNKFKIINEFTDLVAHRKRDRGRAFESIQAAIDNGYEVKKGTTNIKGYNGIHYNEWEKNGLN